MLRTMNWSKVPLLAALALAGCNSQGTTNPDEERLGSLDMALTVSGLEVRVVRLEVVGESNGVVRQRIINVADPNATVSARESGLLAGAYSVKLSANPAVDDPATEADETKILCSGQVGGVQVVAGETTTVDDLVLLCTVDGGKVQVGGAIRVNATATVEDADEDCEDVIVLNAFVGALATSVGTSVSLRAEVVSGATFAWTAGATGIGDPTSSYTTFTCPAQPGPSNITLTATKGACQESSTVVVECIGAGLPVCGNDVVEGSETCDDGNTVTEACEYGVTDCEVCNSVCQLVTSVGQYCGDGIVNGPEGCDGGPNCSANCTVVVPDPVCGNGVAETGEGCDDGNTIKESCAYGVPVCEVCGASCQLESSTGAFCGDGVVNGGEACDGTPNCTAQCTLIVAVCGNGAQEPGEGCDDGNTVTESCAYGVPQCEVCGANCQTQTVSGPYCGDGVVNGGEECDGGAGCSSSCQTELSVADRCEACMRTIPDPDFQAANEQLCNGDPLCVNLKQCLLNDTSDPDTVGRSCFNFIPAACYCGITRNFDACESDPNFVALGPCAAQTIAGVGNAATPQEVFQRLTDFEYPSGKAYQIVDFARQICGQECGFTRVD